MLVLRKAVPLFLCVAVLLTLATESLAPSLGLINTRTNAAKVTQRSGINWNNTDCTANKVLTPPQGMNKTTAPRIMVEYEDCLVTIYTRIGYDVNNDGKCNMYDIGLEARAFDLTAGSPNWNQTLDINGDFKVNMKDIGAVAKHFGEHYP